MSEKKQYYRVLGLPDGTPTNLVTKAYKKLALQTHPGKHPDQSHRFTEISEAYLKLLPRDKRKKMPKDHNEMYAHHFSSLFQDSKNPNSRFNLFFGGSIPMNGKASSSSAAQKATADASPEPKNTKTKAELEEEKRRKLEMELIEEEEAAKRAEIEAEQKKKEAAKAAEVKRKKAEQTKKRREKEQEEQIRLAELQKEKERKEQQELEARLIKEDEERVRQADLKKKALAQRLASENSRRAHNNSASGMEGDDGWAVVGKSKSNTPEEDEDETPQEPSNLAEMVKQLGDMGFGLKRANLALKMKNYNLEQAINGLLTDEIPDIPDTPEPQQPPVATKHSKKKKKSRGKDNSPAGSPKSNLNSPSQKPEKTSTSSQLSHQASDTNQTDRHQSSPDVNNSTTNKQHTPAMNDVTEEGKGAIPGAAGGAGATANGTAGSGLLSHHFIMQQALVRQIQLQRIQKMQQLQQQARMGQNGQQPQILIPVSQTPVSTAIPLAQPAVPLISGAPLQGLNFQGTQHQQMINQPQPPLAQNGPGPVHPSNPNMTAAVTAAAAAVAAASAASVATTAAPVVTMPSATNTTTTVHPVLNGLSRQGSLQPPGLENRRLSPSIDMNAQQQQQQQQQLSASSWQPASPKQQGSAPGSTPDTPLWTPTQKSASADWGAPDASLASTQKKSIEGGDTEQANWLENQDLLTQTASWLHDLKIDDDDDNLGNSSKSTNSGGGGGGWEGNSNKESKILPSLLKPWDISGSEKDDNKPTFAEPEWLSGLSGNTWGGLLGDEPSTTKMPWGGGMDDPVKAKRAPPGFTEDSAEVKASETRRFVVITNISPRTTELDLRRMARQFGQVVNTHQTGSAITIEFASAAEAAKAAGQLSNKTVDGSTLNTALESSSNLQPTGDTSKFFPGSMVYGLDPGAESFSPFPQF